MDGAPPTYITDGVVKEAGKWYLCPNTGHEIIHNRCYPTSGAEGAWKANHPTICPPGSTLYCEFYSGRNWYDTRGTVNNCLYQHKTMFPDVDFGTNFDDMHGLVIGSRDFAQVYAGDVDGVAPDDIVAVYEDGAVEIFLTKYNTANPQLVTSGGVGFHSMGIVMGAGQAVVSTVNFVGALFGFGTTCRGKDFGCTSSERAVFVGTTNTDDYMWVSPRVVTRAREDGGGANRRRSRRLSEYTVAEPDLATLLAGEASVAPSNGFAQVEQLATGTGCYASYGALCRSDRPNADESNCLKPADEDRVCPNTHPTCRGAYETWEEPLLNTNCHPHHSGADSPRVREYEFTNRVFMPEDQQGYQRTMSGSLQECMDRCSSIGGCDYVSYTIASSDCFLRMAVVAFDPSTCDPYNGITHYQRSWSYGACTTMEPALSIAFSPLANTRHRTLSSARFYTDIDQRHQGLLIGTGRESPNALAYLGFPGFLERYVGVGTNNAESVAVSALRVAAGINFFCFANLGSANACIRNEIDPNFSRENKVVGDLQSTFVNSPPPSPPPPPPSVRRLTACAYEETLILYDESTGLLKVNAMHPLPHFEALPGNDGNDATTQDECKDLCEITPECNIVLFLPPNFGTAETNDGHCYLFSKEEEGLEEAWVGQHSLWNQYGPQGAGLSPPSDPTGAPKLTRVCGTKTGGGVSEMFHFGDVNEETSDIKITFLDGDEYPDVITSSGRDHVRVYRGTQESLRTGDYSRIMPETFASPGGRRLQAWSRYPGDARHDHPLPNVQQIFVWDFNNDNKNDLFLHAPALSPGACAQRCHSLGRFGFDRFKLHHAGYAQQHDAHEESYCYCGPHYNEMVAPFPPPSPPKPPPSPFDPPSIPPVQSPGVPPPSPPFPIYRAAGMCILHAGYDLPPTSPAPPPSPPQPPSLPSPPSPPPLPPRLPPSPPSPPPPSPPPLRPPPPPLPPPSPSPPPPPPSPPKPPPPPNWPPPLPGAPPLATGKESRLLFYDLTDEVLKDVRGSTGTAWIPEGAKVMRSGFYKFFDEPFIQAVHLTEKSCPEMADNGLNSFETNQSRSQVNFDAS